MDDPTRNKHQGNPASEQAWRHVGDRAETQRKYLLRLFSEAGPAGLTSTEIERRIKIAKNRFSGRLTELKVLGLIRGTCQFRENCEVLVAIAFHPKAKQAPRQGNLFDTKPKPPDASRM